MGLEAIKDQLNSGETNIVNDNWDVIVAAHGKLIALYREYVKGDQRLELTDERAKLMGILKEEGERFKINYCKPVRDKLANRLEMRQMKADNDPATKWAESFAKDVRFDGLQVDVYKATVGEGDSFLMVDSMPLDDGEFPGLVKEPAYNGHTGVIAVYDVTKRFIVAVVKIWDDPVITDEDTLRVNIYYADRIEMFTDDGELKPFVDPKNEESVIPWIGNKSKTALGVPFFHFKNDAEDGTETGQAHIKSIISSQDAINYIGLDIVGAAGLTATPPKFTVGLPVFDGDVRIGMLLALDPDGTDTDKHKPQVGTFAQGKTDPLVDAAKFFVDQLGAASSTPLPDTMGSSASSGEALKQREVDQIQMADVLQTKFGNVLEDVFAYANMLQNELGNNAPPESKTWDAKWKSAQTRSDSDIIKNIVAVKDFLDQRTILEEIGKITTFQWDTARIDEILLRRREEIDQVNNPPVPPGTPETGDLDTLLGQIEGLGNAVAG